MNWEPHLLKNLPLATDLPSRIDELFAHQRAHWKLLSAGEAALSHIRTKILTQDGARVLVQENPGRKRSVHAKTDPQSIARRACFLCPENLPAEERGIAFGDLVILPNPFPVSPRHCTITDREHRPQRLEGRLTAMLELAKALGPEMLVFYNGPRCGASAPDHFHFQACDAEKIPILSELNLAGDPPPRITHASFGRRMFLFADRHPAALEQHISRSLDAMSQQDASGDEPMVNLLVIFTGGYYFGILVPRTAHRPACYFAEGAQRLAISPASLEMAGLLVVAEPGHFDRVDVATTRTIYEQVGLDASQFDRLEEAMK